MINTNLRRILCNYLCNVAPTSIIVAGRRERCSEAPPYLSSPLLSPDTTLTSHRQHLTLGAL